ncbi:hypothetical protein Q5Y75_14615 [Ruegeria sp. 2205SS24-7]|uniref:hypothetical protein n=1 Tax=Ruegeria discodermiae TaxID=3064389 RepID=UPI0027410220|nr:hypothetical protein [Ruegeria sp. 2205SS24-7]MDP5218461.1 hypothetical protein [Ruegeria sp. 2205SS24-7]
MAVRPRSLLEVQFECCLFIEEVEIFIVTFAGNAGFEGQLYELFGDREFLVDLLAQFCRLRLRVSPFAPDRSTCRSGNRAANDRANLAGMLLGDGGEFPGCALGCASNLAGDLAASAPFGVWRSSTKQPHVLAGLFDSNRDEARLFDYALIRV